MRFAKAGREPSAGGPGPLGCGLLAHELDDAPARPAVRSFRSAADRINDRHGPMLAPQPRKRFTKHTVIVHGTLVPTRATNIAAPKNYGYSTNHQIVIDADTCLVVTVGRPKAGNRDN